ncbi:hypothetical protein [Microbulbifer celer]|uniref:Uncharacterized protein n=1 Tax=Microbulbifer celer TaxID=435905 RepID=A0ABW3U8P7_9GAMM|nr:hypothetical protein [Microbulbifer celer]UFN57008.1 hypothetical protein LPW13_15800 [Microbulbifer celer]
MSIQPENPVSSPDFRAFFIPVTGIVSTHIQVEQAPFWCVILVQYDETVAAVTIAGG